MKFLLDLASGKLTPTKAPTGLSLDNKDVIKGLVVEAADEETASSLMSDALLKWQDWIDKYNYWVMDPERDTKFPYTFPDTFNKEFKPKSVVASS